MDIDNLCNEFQYMCSEQKYETDLDCENNKPQYFAGFYIIWKGENPIFIDSFIFRDYEANTEYKADKLLWEHHKEDFRKNRFSELNESIGDLSKIDIEIIECHLFNKDDTYKEIKEIVDYQLNIFRKEYGENVFKKKKDNYNMTDLLESLEYCLEVDELFGEQDE